jgi:hypothetical protein
VKHKQDPELVSEKKTHVHMCQRAVAPHLIVERA